MIWNLDEFLTKLNDWNLICLLYCNLKNDFKMFKEFVYKILWICVHAQYLPKATQYACKGEHIGWGSGMEKGQGFGVWGGMLEG